MLRMREAVWQQTRTPRYWSKTSRPDRQQACSLSTLRGAVGGLFNITSSRPTVTVYGNISFNGTNRVNTTIAINTTQFNGTGVTLISYNVTASGEAMNISEIIVELNGTSISSADVQSVSL